MSTTDTPIVIPSGSVLELAFGTEVRGQVMKHVDACFDAANAASRKFGELVREAQMAEIAAARLFHCANDEKQRAVSLGIMEAEHPGRMPEWALPSPVYTLGEKLNAARCPESVKPQAHLVLPPAHMPIDAAVKEPEVVFNITFEGGTWASGGPEKAAQAISALSKQSGKR